MNDFLNDFLKWQKPLILEGGLFTPLSRTPWAGTALSRGLKKKWTKGCAQPIGESWEFSCDPDFLSHVRGDPSLSLQTLGEQLSLNIEILVKLLNAAEPLSVQVHPSDEDSALRSHECGKPESWLVLDAEPGAGIYIGFREEETQEGLRKAFQNGSFQAERLQFVSVKPMDYFEIAPGTPHAVAPGTIILEPQRALAGKSGKTYRLWDWNRKYAADGSFDLQQGKERELHIEQGLRLLQLHECWGMNYVETLRRTPTVKQVGSSVIHEFPSNPYYHVRIFVLEGSASLHLTGGYGVWLQLENHLVMEGKNGHCQVGEGDTVFLPPQGFPLKIFGTTNSRGALICNAGSNLRTML